MKSRPQTLGCNLIKSKSPPAGESQAQVHPLSQNGGNALLVCYPKVKNHNSQAKVLLLPSPTPTVDSGWWMPLVNSTHNTSLDRRKAWRSLVSSAENPCGDQGSTSPVTLVSQLHHHLPSKLCWSSGPAGSSAGSAKLWGLTRMSPAGVFTHQCASDRKKYITNDRSTTALGTALHIVKVKKKN